MPKSKYEFIKIEMRLFNDPRFIVLNDFEQLAYIKLIALAKQTHNHIKKDYRAIKAYFHTEQPPRKIKATIKQLCSNFEDLAQNNYNLWFVKWNERYDYDGVEKEKEKEKDKDKEEEKEIISSFKKTKRYFKGEEMRFSRNKWWILPKDGSSWLEFTGSLKDTELK